MNENASARDLGLNGLVHALYAHAASPRDGDKAARSRQLLGNVPVIDDPADIDELAKRPEQFRKNYSMVSALGFSRFNTDGDDWATRRNLTQPAYLDAAKSSRRKHIFETYDRVLGDSEASFEAIQEALFVASLTIFFEAFGMTPEVGPTVELLDRVRVVLRELQYFSWVAPSEEEERKATAEARAVIAEFAALLARNERAAAVMERFAREAKDVEGFSPVEEFVMNLFAGVETTVATTSWVMDRLGVNHDVQERIRSEIAAGGETPYAECMINETMRFFPPIPFLIRQVATGTSIGSMTFWPGQLVLMSVVGAHHHPDYWSEPQAFESSRREFMEDSYDRRAFIPFLTGPRMCGGMRLGKLEVQEAVRALVPKFAVERRDNIVRFDYALALRPVIGDSLAVTRR